jgi:hypothetical protein
VDVASEAPQPPLSPNEVLLLDQVRRGAGLDLAEGEPVDTDAMRSWDSSHEVNAAVIRDILRGRLVSDPDPHGVRLRGARLVGRLDLENLTTTVNVDLRDCLLPDGLVACDARLAALRLEGCLVETASGSAVAAERLVASVMVLRAATVVGHGPAGAVSLPGARLDRLDCDGARLRNGCGPALRADSIQVDQRAFLRRGFEAVGAGRLGTVRLNGARLGQFAADRAALRNDSGPALVAEAMQVDRGCA